MAKVRLDITQAGALTECISCRITQNKVSPIKAIRIGNTLVLDMCKECREKLSDMLKRSL